MNASHTAERLELHDRGRLIDRLREVLPSLLPDRAIALAYLYGSAATGSATSLSDVDIAVVARDYSVMAQRFDLEAGLAMGLERHGVPRADVRIINDAPIMLKGTVVTEGILVYSADEEFRIEFETLTRRQYFDYAPVARRMQSDYIRTVLERPERATKAAR